MAYTGKKIETKVYDVYTKAEIDTDVKTNPVFLGDSITIPSGTTAERPSVAIVGMLRYNTTLGFVEQYTTDGWQGIAPPPTITGIDVTNVEESDTDQVIVINGTTFDTTAVGLLVDANGVTLNPTISVRNSSNQITITFSGADRLTSSIPQPIDVKVNNGSGLSASLENALTVDATPIWTTASGNIGTVLEDVSMSSIALVASDPEGSTVTYSLSSGALPSGVSLSSNGIITGTPNVNDPYTASGVVHNFTIDASDGTGNTTPRTFNILRKWLDGSTSDLAAPSALSIKNITGTTTNGFYYIKPEGYAGNAIQVYCDMANDGGGWMLMSAAGTDVFYLHVNDAAYNVSFTPNSMAVNGNYREQSGFAVNLGQSFIDAMVVANRQSSIARFNIKDGGTTWRPHFILSDANARWYDIYNRSSTVDNTSSCDATRRNLSGNTWLKTAYYGYIADSGNGGVGTLSGTPNTQGASCWGTFPYNMDTDDQYGENWGYSIAPNYSATFANPNNQYPSCHSNGWNRPGNFWLKAS
jgi:hypothetical protein